jgi:hypothetical protein
MIYNRLKRPILVFGRRDAVRKTAREQDVDCHSNEYPNGSSFEDVYSRYLMGVVRSRLRRK